MALTIPINLNIENLAELNAQVAKMAGAAGGAGAGAAGGEKFLGHLAKMKLESVRRVVVVGESGGGSVHGS